MWFWVSEGFVGLVHCFLGLGVFFDWECVLVIRLSLCRLWLDFIQAKSRSLGS